MVLGKLASMFPGYGHSYLSWVNTHLIPPKERALLWVDDLTLWKPGNHSVGSIREEGKRGESQIYLLHPDFVRDLVVGLLVQFPCHICSQKPEPFVMRNSQEKRWNYPLWQICPHSLSRGMTGEGLLLGAGIPVWRETKSSMDGLFLRPPRSFLPASILSFIPRTHSGSSLKTLWTHSGSSVIPRTLSGSLLKETVQWKEESETFCRVTVRWDTASCQERTSSLWEALTSEASHCYGAP